ncbi:transcription initiation factor TFIID subunit 9 [Tanacetum coccineum]
MADGNDNKARDAKMIKELLESMGVKEYEPAVIDKFQELYYRTAVDLLTDAQRYSSHADKATIDIADVQLAIESRRYLNDTQPPSLEVIEAAMTTSTTAVPRPPSEGVSLPPESDMLISSKDLDEMANKQKEDENAPARFPNFSA